LTYLLVSQLFKVFVFNLFVLSTSWRFASITILMVVLITSVLVIAMRLDGKRKLPWVIIAGTIGFPTSRLLLLAIDKYIYPFLIPTDFTIFNLTITNGIFGSLFGLLLGFGLGLQKENNTPQINS